ncbi:unnamed protein product [Linum trigynum]|uniref:CCHC-type domain-containing protein n=1 Tax=Linum trigynum TaxID=586398 RepID=A0AAV2F793_9ROSI
MAMLLGKWVTDSSINLHKAKNAAINKWRAYGEVQTTKEAENLFVYTFQSQQQRDAVWDARPWNLSNTLVALKKWDGEQKAEAENIETITLWVQIHDLPQSLKDEEAIKALAEYIFPQFHCIDQSNFDCRGWLKFIRAKVEVQLDQPIPIGFEYPLGEKSIWVSFKYERIMDLCFFCGRLGHLIHNCLEREDHQRRGLSIDPSEVYTAALKAGHDSPANTPPASFREKMTRNQRPTLTGHPTGLIRGPRGETTLLQYAGQAGHSSSSSPPGFTAITLPLPEIGTEWVQRGKVNLPATNFQPTILEREMEATTKAMQRSLDLGEGGRSREKAAGLFEMGRSLSLASPFYYHDNSSSPTTAKSTAGPVSTPTEQAPNQNTGKEVATEEEEPRTRPEKKRKPDRVSPSCPNPQTEASTNFSFDSLAFVPGENRITYQRRKYFTKRRSLTELTAEGNQSGEGESNSLRAAAASLEPPNQG